MKKFEYKTLETKEINDTEINNISSDGYIIDMIIPILINEMNIKPFNVSQELKHYKYLILFKREIIDNK